MVERLDPQFGIFAIVGEIHVREHLPTICEVRIVDLHDDPGIGDGLVLLVQHVGDREQETLIIWVVLVPEPVLDVPRRDDRQVRLDVKSAYCGL